jgi:three-Cys-motif partner protein
MAARVIRDPHTLDFPFYATIQPGRLPHKTKFSADPIWTRNKAKLIEKYLFQFVFVTHHGTYIDGFAGPQRVNHPEMWAAKLVLEITPRLLRKFYLYDLDKKKVALLENLRDSQPPPDKSKKEPKRLISVKQGDANVLIRQLLKSKAIGQNEATFCLLDQRNIECEWSTLAALSSYRKNGHKIELLYFLPSAWLNRALKNRRDKTTIKKWWGRQDWKEMERMPSLNRVELFKERFKKELGYWSAEAWPIFVNNSRSRIMYYMIHATDHPAAPYLMQRAYRKAVGPPESPEEVQLDINHILKAVVEPASKSSYRPVH